MKIIRDPHALQHGSLVAPIRVLLGGVEFPNPKWTDFLVSVLLYWTENLLALLSTPRTPPPMQGRYQLTFIDGPWTVLLGEVAEDGQLLLEAAQKAPGSHIDPDVVYTVRAVERSAVLPLVTEVRRAAEAVLEHCLREGLAATNGDVDALSEALPQLSALETRLATRA